MLPGAAIRVHSQKPLDVCHVFQFLATSRRGRQRSWRLLRLDGVLGVIVSRKEGTSGRTLLRVAPKLN